MSASGRGTLKERHVYVAVSQRTTEKIRSAQDACVKQSSGSLSHQSNPYLPPTPPKNTRTSVYITHMSRVSSARDELLRQPGSGGRSRRHVYGRPTAEEPKALGRPFTLQTVEHQPQGPPAYSWTLPRWQTEAHCSLLLGWTSVSKDTHTKQQHEQEVKGQQRNVVQRLSKGVVGCSSANRAITVSLK